MPVAQKTGPDGCLYVLDWYDQYHCYQDARRDPAGIERAKGRLYRVRYKDTPRAPQFDLAKETDDQLLARLASPNVYYRDIAQRLLAERNTPVIVERLAALVNDTQAPSKQRRHAMFALVGCDLLKHKREWSLPEKLIKSDEAWVRAWALRCAGNHALRAVREPAGSESLEMTIASLILAGLEDTSPDVRLQAIILVGQLARANRTYVAYDDQVAAALLKSPNDGLLARIAWQSLRPYHDLHPTGALAFLRHEGMLTSLAGRELAPRIVECAVTNSRADAGLLRGLFDGALPDGKVSVVGGEILRAVAARLQSGEIGGQREGVLHDALRPALDR